MLGLRASSVVTRANDLLFVGERPEVGERPTVRVLLPHAVGSGRPEHRFCTAFTTASR